MSENSADNNGRAARFGKALGYSAWVIFGLLGLSSVVLLVILQFLPDSADAFLTEKTTGQLVLYAFQYLLALAIVLGIPYAIAKLRGRPQSKAALARLLGLTGRLNWRTIGLLGICFLAYLVTTIIAAAFAASFFPWYDAEQTQEIGFKNVAGSTDLILTFFALVVLPPIAEELLFRGYLFGKLRRINGFWVSTIITSILFGLVHLQWNVGIDTFVLSIFLCYLREKTGSIGASMLLHGIKNSIAYFFLFIAPLLGIQLQ